MSMYLIRAQYMADVKLEVEVEDGEDPKDPANWISIESENQYDYSLWDVIDATEQEDA